MLRATVIVMKYLSTLDAALMKAEISDPHVSLAVDLVFGIIADYEDAPDVGEIPVGMTRAVSRLAALSVAPRGSTTRGKPTLIDDRVRAVSRG